MHLLESVKKQKTVVGETVNLVTSRKQFFEIGIP